jgi:hypothetical protein
MRLLILDEIFIIPIDLSKIRDNFAWPGPSQAISNGVQREVYDLRTNSMPFFL